MFEALARTGLRARLTAAILIVAVAVVVASFVALHQVAGSDLKSQVDDQLATDYSEFQRSPAGRAGSEAQLARAAREFVRSQGYHADSRVFAIGIGTDERPLVTNHRDAIAEELAEHGHRNDDDDEAPAAGALLDAPEGYVTVTGPEGAQFRVLSSPIDGVDGRIGTFRVAQSLTPIDDAQSSLAETLLLVGAVAIGILLAAAVLIGGLLARPLSRVAGFAAGMGTSELDRRLPEDSGPSEVRSLSHSLNRMLDRLQRSFAREREFVADASHELRTPLTVAQGELELLRRESSDDERPRIDLVRRELRRMERLVSEMLLLASQDSGADMRPETVELADLLSDLRRDLPLMGPRRYEVAEVSGSIVADPDRLAQVFRNLLANAVAHTDEQGRVSVGARVVGDRVRFDITDDGPGFAPDEAEKLFERFFRSGRGRSRSDGGSGLGLAIARSIVEGHGGRIWIEPAGEAEGAHVAFDLPGYSAPAQ